MKFIYMLGAFLVCAVAASQAQFVPGIGGVPGLPILPPIIPGLLGFPFFRPFFGIRRSLLWSIGVFGKRDTENADPDIIKQTDKAMDDEKKVDDSRDIKKIVDDKKSARDVEEDKKTVRDTMTSQTDSESAKKLQRAIDTVVSALVADKEPLPAHTICNVTSSSSQSAAQIECDGLNHNFTCKLRSQLASVTQLIANDLDFVRNETDTNSIRLVVPRTQATTVDSGVVISLFNGKHDDLVGFEVVDADCWTQLSSLVGTLRPQEVSVNLAIIGGSSSQ